MTKRGRYLSAEQAADALNISLPTLYAYVSRGLIRSEAVGGSKRNRRYSAEDVERLKARKEARQNPEKIAQDALHFGAPLLDSAITLIEDGRLYYRGVDATMLAQTHTIEQVAALLWTGSLETPLPPVEASPPRWESTGQLADGLTVFEQFQVFLPLAAAADPAAYDLRPAAVIQTGARILNLLTSIVAGGQVQDGIAQRLAGVWCPGEARETAKLLGAALVLCADHELNISAFTARCVASAGAAPYAAVNAGLAALQGTKHGGNTARVEALLREVGAAEQAQTVIVERLKRGETIPGFGHPLYPEGDPRAQTLLAMAAAQPGLGLPVAVCEAVEAITGEPPNVDFALVALARGLGLPAGAALTLFALGRTVGWIGHILEQYATDHLIRPRARYVGLPPQG